MSARGLPLRALDPLAGGRGTRSTSRVAPAAKNLAPEDGAESVFVARRLGSKAETLVFLERRLRRAVVPALVHFPVAEWRSDPRAVLARIAARLRAPRLAVRSSARGEDDLGCSLAGRYRSRLDVENASTPVREAIDEVVSSYDGADGDQVLVQEMAPSVAASGVVLTRDPETAAPYYVVEYHDGSPRTDVVTSGRGGTKTLWIHHGAPLAMVRSPRLLRLLAAVREVEQIAGPRLLEIEFAEASDGTVFVLQVRAIVARVPAAPALDGANAIAEVARLVESRGAPRAGLPGRRSLLGQMPDWNPAELIGARPSPLAASLFRFLISDEVWRRARATMGYRRLPGVPLVRFLLGRPYVDVRASFASFLPAGLPAEVESALVDAWIDRLDAHPELHDRVELEVAQTAFDLDFSATHSARHGELLSPSSFRLWADALRRLTNAALASGGTLERSLVAVERLAECREGAPSSRDEPLARGLALLAACREHGTYPFAVVARHAFLATALLRSAVRRGALSDERCGELHRSLRTVARELALDLADLAAGRKDRDDFLRTYGHLRPGTFDIASLRYDQRSEVLSHAWHDPQDERPGDGRAAPASPRFELTSREAADLERLLGEAKLAATAESLLRHAAAAIVGRERAKFQLTRRLSDALECIAEWGAARGLSREDLAHLSLADLHRACERPARTRRWLRDRIARGRARAAEWRGVRLAPLLRSSADVWVSPEHATRASFVTARSVTAAPVLLHRRLPIGDVSGRIVCIESADPGFDWIFAQKIAGLVTGFGGGNSHMAIRCIELDVPAALGVGERALARLARSPSVELRCGEGIARSTWPDVLA